MSLRMVARLRRTALATTAGLLMVLGACQDSGPAGPQPGDSSELLSGILSPLLGSGGSGSGEAVDVLRRSVPLAADEVATARVGLLGATLRLPNSGLTVVIPAGAAPIGTRITVTSPAGDLVGYHFEPHGLRFRLPVVMTQDLGGTEADPALLDLLVGAYFEGDLAPTVNALEILPLDLQVRALSQAILTIRHFSGYVVATNYRGTTTRR